MKNDGGPAFPFAIEDMDGSIITWKGMSRRDYFAAHLSIEDIYVPSSVELCAAYIGVDAKNYKPEIHYNQVVCKARYAYADLMLKERDK